MPNNATVRRRSLLVLFAALFSVGSAGRANAEGFIAPFIGYNFGGKAGCQQITNCEDKHANYGAAFGALGSVVGFEAEFAYTNDFFGSTSSQSSKVLTFMGNFMLAPKIGPIQPYGLAGLGLIRSSVSGAGTSSTDQNQFGYDVGGGLMAFFNAHVGVRGDIRYYHSFNVFDTSNFPNLPAVSLNGEKLDYGRAAIGVVFKF